MINNTSVCVIILFLLVTFLYGYIFFPRIKRQSNQQKKVKPQNIHNQNKIGTTQVIHAKSIGLNERQELNKLSNDIVAVLNSLSQNASHISIHNESPLSNAINNLTDYLKSVSEKDLYLIQMVHSEVMALDIDIPSSLDYGEKYNQLVLEIQKLVNLFYSYTLSYGSYSDFIKKFYDTALEEINAELLKFRKLKEFLANSARDYKLNCVIA